MNHHPTAQHADTIRAYLRELGKGHAAGVTRLFASDARIYSPLMGWVAPEPFYARLLDVSGTSTLTLHDILSSSQGHERAIAYFRYDWTLKNGQLASFDCVDVFDFNTAGQIDRLIIIYDTYPVRQDVGNALG